MLKSRVIPFLLLHKGALYKTINFKSHKYIGDPINAVRIFNEMCVDELVLLDIDATTCQSEINYDLLSKISRECRMPFCYGGGVKNISQINKLISLGIEKVSISSAAFYDKNLITSGVKDVGSQSIVVVLDIKKVGILNKKYKVFINNGTICTNLDPLEFALELIKLGVGEIIINNIDYDGTCNGYDFEIIDMIYKYVPIPITILGGAKSYEELAIANQKYKIIGLGAGSLFVYQGKYKAVLINYPDKAEKSRILD